MTDQKKPRLPAAPKGIGTTGRKLWNAVLEDFELADHEMVLLSRACCVADTCADLQAVVDAEGPLATSRLGEQRAHPALVELRAQSLLLARLIVALRVPLGDQEEAGGHRDRVRPIRGFYGLQGGAG